MTVQFIVIHIHFPGSPNCPTVNTTVNTALLAVSILKSPMMWLPEWYFIEVSYFNGSIAEVYNSTVKGSASFDVTSLQPGTVYNISVIPCNMAGCNELCDVYSVQPDKEGEMNQMHRHSYLCTWLKPHSIHACMLYAYSAMKTLHLSFHRLHWLIQPCVYIFAISIHLILCHYH